MRRVVWYDQTATVDGVKGNGRRSTVEHWYKAMVITLIDCEDGQTDGACQWPYV
jgi:hypothetical protein